MRNPLKTVTWLPIFKDSIGNNVFKFALTVVDRKLNITLKLLLVHNVQVKLEIESCLYIV